MSIFVPKVQTTTGLPVSLPISRNSVKFWTVASIISIAAGGALHVTSAAPAASNQKHKDTSTTQPLVNTDAPKAAQSESSANEANSETSASVSQSSSSSTSSQADVSASINGSVVTVNGEVMPTPTDGSTITRSTTSEDGSSKTVVSVTGNQSSSSDGSGSTSSSLHTSVRSSTVSRGGSSGSSSP